MSKDRFRKQPPSPVMEWAKRRGISSGMTRISSPAHLMRVLYALGALSKTDLVDLCQKTVCMHQRKLKALRKRGGQEARERIADRKLELNKATEALDEVKGLPDDETER